MDYKEPWDLVEEAIELSKIPRINYKEILGESLTLMAYKYCKKHRHWEECFVDVIDKLPEELQTEEVLKKVKIRICAAYSEQGINTTAFREACLKGN